MNAEILVEFSLNSLSWYLQTCKEHEKKRLIGHWIGWIRSRLEQIRAEADREERIWRIGQQGWPDLEGLPLEVRAELAAVLRRAGCAWEAHKIAPSRRDPDRREAPPESGEVEG